LIYLDTSVLAPFYWTEAASESVEQLFEQHTQLIISELSEVELISALSRRVRMGEIERADASSIAARFQAALDAEFYQLVTVTPLHYQMAKQWMQQFDTPLRTLDALHLAIASGLSVPLVTADVGLAKSATSLSVDVQILMAQ
jgi:uncharacterized protein